MFQSFTSSSRPDQGPPRLAALRAAMQAEGLDGFLVPRADVHQGEYVSDRDARLAWLTGFTGSAGFCAALMERAGVFVDGRYRVQVRDQVADVFTPVNWPETRLGDWLADALPNGGRIGLDPWLHTLTGIETLQDRLKGTGITLVETGNLVDCVRIDRPDRPKGRISGYPIELAGKTAIKKCTECAGLLRKDGHTAAVLTLPDSICWLLNIRGADVPRIPIAQAFVILHDTGRAALFTDPEKLADLPSDPNIDVADRDTFKPALKALAGVVRVDKGSAPLAITRSLEQAEIRIAYADDPCILPKACKTRVEIEGARAAHLRDAAAMIEFLTWLDTEAPKGGLTEIDVVKNLEGFRRATDALQDISFDTICGAGSNGAIVHYRVTEATSQAVVPGELLLIDSGGQYLDGTTDITRTVAIGDPTDEQKACFTRVLKGMIGISRARWPVGLTGRDLDPLARIHLWRAGQDYDHGTGHGVGAYLSVHEGPQRISRNTDVKLQPGMILSNEPGYYREDAFGIRIENLVVVQEAPDLPGGDLRKMLDFLTLTFVPIDRRLIDPAMLDREERDWLNAYHAETVEKTGDRLGDAARTWLSTATQPI